MNTVSTKRKNSIVIINAIVVVAAVIGVYLSYLGGREAFMGGSSVFMFFTTQSNVAVAIICALNCFFLMKGQKTGEVWFVIRYVGTVAITLTGMVYCFVLAPSMGFQSWNVQNVLTHVVVPVVSVFVFFREGTEVEIRKRNVIFVIIPPVLYAIYAGVGYVNNWQFVEGYNYPYFFLNWGSPAGAFGFTSELPFMGCVWWILALLVFLLVVGYGYLALLLRMSAKRVQKEIM